MRPQAIEDRGLKFHPNTPKALRTALITAHKFKYKIRIFYGCLETGEVDLKSEGVIGYVKESGGVFFPLVISARKGSSKNADFIEDDRILAVMDVEARGYMYRHEKFEPPKLEVFAVREYIVVDQDDNIVERFSNESLANNYVGFMRGEKTRLIDERSLRQAQSFQTN